ncbi:FecR family protein [Chryseolinea soli]|uniref:FecR family protein n=1 Tax=Chryseolinea soli TaxID=2321403 RepID=A0A385SFH8_9BACT|nr:FecR family protein [Chryseolinea soli]AYB29136.1 FecR family protein [Chryseolinea soli]
MSPQEIDKILQRYLNYESTPEEQQLVERWFDAIGEEKTELEPATREAIQKRLWSSLNVEKSKRQGYTKYVRVAASIVLLAVSTFYLYRYFTPNLPHEQTMADANAPVVVTSGDLEKRVELSDGSVVTLKPRSELRFPSVFGTQREVNLSGEALFEVARNVQRPFLVHANEVTTRVLGTSFLIKAYALEQDITVTVKTGKVSVYTEHASNKTDQRQEIILTPNQQIVYHRNEDQTVKMLVSDPQVITPQSSQRTSYTNVPVPEIFHALEERYGIPIQFDPKVLSGCTITYADLTEEGLYEQIEIICNALGARYEKSASSIVIEAEGCK